jgi:hypothetical protein
MLTPFAVVVKPPPPPIPPPEPDVALDLPPPPPPPARKISKTTGPSLTPRVALELKTL